VVRKGRDRAWFFGKGLRKPKALFLRQRNLSKVPKRKEMIMGLTGAFAWVSVSTCWLVMIGVAKDQ
jgi:hypothetical protein